MYPTTGGGAAKRKNKENIALYILDRQGTSRQELAEALGLSMPTVFQYVNRLMAQNIICEAGEYGSTGGRKARILTARQGVCCALGVEISARHARLVLLDLSRKVLAVEAVPLPYENAPAYYEALGRLARELAEKHSVGPNAPYQLVGVGLAIPGIIDQDREVLLKSHALGVADIDLKQFRRYIPYQLRFGNDANLAAYAEVRDTTRNTLYLSLNDTIGGALYLQGGIYPGDNWKSGEFGHMVAVPGGKPCYCGKQGCLDAYCSAKVLRRRSGHLKDFFAGLDAGDRESRACWEEYLEHLAVAASNLRMAFDCDIILGGDVGGYMEPYMPAFMEKLARYNNFDPDSSYVRPGHFKRESAAIGAGRQMLDRFVRDMVRDEP